MSTDVRTCTRCGESKPIDEFPPKRRGEAKRQSWCRSCFAKNNARYYQEHRETQKARLLRNTTARREGNKQRVADYLTTHPCVDCGETDIVVLQFDHVRDKISNVSALIADGVNWQRIEREIAKCEVRCANCHRLKTAQDWRLPPRAAQAAMVVVQPRKPIQLPLAAAIDLRVCRVCGQTKSLTEFPLRSMTTQTRQWICLECQRAYTKAWYANNRERQIANARRNTADRRTKVRELILPFRVACVDCGENNPVLLDFDHLKNKTADISYMVHIGLPWTTIKAEIDKCVIRCANCHAKKTAREQGSYRTRAI